MATENNEEFYKIEVTDIDGRRHEMGKYKGNVLLIVNVASKCGLAQKSYTELSDLLVTYGKKGLKVLLFPCKQFFNQEYKEKQKIKEFIANYSDDFILMDYVDVMGQNIHPLYKYLTKNLTGFITNDIKWNFTYFLIGRNGVPVKRYGQNSTLSLTDPYLVKCIGDQPSKETEHDISSYDNNFELNSDSDKKTKNSA